MARVETKKQLHLTSEEFMLLRKVENLFLDIGEEDSGGEVFCQADNYESEWCWLTNFISNLIANVEVE